MSDRIAMTPSSLRAGARRCRTVARHTRTVVRGVEALPEPEGMAPEVRGQLRAAANQLDRSAAAAERQAGWLLHRAARGALADGPFGSDVDLLAPPLLSPWDIPPGPEKPLKVPDPGESLLDRLFGRDYVLPEEAAGVVLEMGVDPTKLLKVLRLGGRAGRRTRTGRVPGGGLGRHEARGGHTLERHVDKTLGDLRARLRREPHLTEASAFNNRELAEDAISGVLTLNGRTIPHLLRNVKGDVVIKQSFDRPIGQIVARDGTVTTTRQVTVVLVRDNSKLGYHVKTAYPSK